MYLRKDILGLSKCPTFVNNGLRSVVIASHTGLPAPNNSMDRIYIYTHRGLAEYVPGTKAPQHSLLSIVSASCLINYSGTQIPCWGILYPHFLPSACFCKDEMSLGAPCDHQVPGPH